MSSPPNREVALFSAALELDVSQRAAYLDEACADDPALRQRLEELLRVHQDAITFLENKISGAQESPLAAEAPAMTVRPSSPAEKPGDRIGRYKLLQQIGEGGCGVVYMAEQEEPVRRRVALKVIKLGMDTKQVIARFEAERQALALMDHPNIAKVLDAGATDTGRPFFVMELVRGIKITDYCDEHNLAMRERLDLFMQVCQAIQHAHQKGVIHRDIKPSNILVADHDGRPVPKVIDFGIAKATSDQHLTDKTVFTAFEQFIGTPAYMSPEQAMLSGLDIDTRTDIYSLGVLLYELLTGKTPLDQKELLAAGLEEMRRTIREKEPLRPSTRLRTMLAGELTTTAKHRQTDAPKLIHLLSGDLDWIVMKCLEKDRARRYETANGLGRDIQRHLNCEPVVARPPSRLYEFQKTVRRHKFGFAAAAALMFVLAVGVFVSGLEAIRAIRAEREQSRLRQAAQTAEALEIAQRKRAETQELAARQRAYGSDMNLVQQALALSNLGRARELLNRQRPHSGQQDLRGWEWRYLWRQCQSDALFGVKKGGTAIGSLAVSPDGKWLAIGENGSGMLFVWDIPTRQWVTQLKTGAGDVRVAFAHHSPLLAYWCGSYFSSGGSRVTLSLWDGTSTRAIPDCGLAGPCQGLAFSGDDQQLVTFTAAPDNEVAVWQVSTGKKVLSMPAEHPGGREGTGFAASRDFSVVAVGCHGGLLRVFDLNKSTELWRAKTGNDEITALALSEDRKTLASASGGITDPQIQLWEVSTGKELGRLEGHETWIGQLTFTPDGASLISASSDETIRVWDTSHLCSRKVLQGHTSEAWRVALSADEKMFFSGAKDGSVLAWGLDLASALSNSVTLPGIIAAWRFAADSRSVTTLDRNGRVCLWSGPGFRENLPLVEIGAHPVGWRTLFSPQGGLLTVGYTNGTAQVWDLEQKALLRDYSAPSKGSVFPVGFLARETRVLLLHMEDVTFHDWDFRTGVELRSWKAPQKLDEVSPAIVSPNEKLCIVPDLSWAWDLVSGTERRLPAGMSSVDSATFSTDGRRFAVASYLGYARMWDTGNWNELATLSGFLIGAHSVAFSPNGERLAVGIAGKEAIKLWDTGSLQEVLTLESPGLYLRTAFSPDGNKLGSMNTQGLLRLWSAPSWAEIEVSEKRANVLSARSIPARSPEASTSLIDLSSFYNAPLTESWHGPGSSDLAELPRGIQTFAGVQFDVRALIQVAAPSSGSDRYPNEVRDIPVHRTCRRLHFLHAAIFGAGAPDGAKIGSYIVHCASGTQNEFPILMGKSVADWWTQPDEQDKTFTIAWVGQNAESRRQGKTIRLFKSTWENPAPGETVRSIDFIGYQKGPAPFLVAVTAE